MECNKEKFNRHEFITQLGKNNKKYNQYDLSGEYGVGWTYNTNNEFYFDLEDYDKIKDYCWIESIHKKGYHSLVARDCITQKKVNMQKVLGCIGYDHANRNPLDNRKQNLRKATASEQSMNRKTQSNNTSGVTGVYYDKRDDLWYAFVYVDKKRITAGTSKSKEDAVVARLKAELQYYGDFAPQKHLFKQYKII